MEYSSLNLAKKNTGFHSPFAIFSEVQRRHFRVNCPCFASWPPCGVKSGGGSQWVTPNKSYLRNKYIYCIQSEVLITLDFFKRCTPLILVAPLTAPKKYRRNGGGVFMIKRVKINEYKKEQETQGFYSHLSVRNCRRVHICI